MPPWAWHVRLIIISFNRQVMLNWFWLRKMDEQYLKTPQYGSRSYATWFLRQGILMGRKKAASMMKTPGIISTAPKPGTSIPGKQHKIYPYLLKGKVINQPNQVWAADITYVPMEKGLWLSGRHHGLAFP